VIHVFDVFPLVKPPVPKIVILHLHVSEFYGVNTGIKYYQPSIAPGTSGNTTDRKKEDSSIKSVPTRLGL